MWKTLYDFVIWFISLVNAKLTQVEKLKGCQNKSTNNEHLGACTDNTTDLEDKHYFDKDNGSCTSFKYNKCGGTFNRYDSEQECKYYCLSILISKKYKFLQR